MDRKQFLSEMGLGAASLFVLSCMGSSCSKTGSAPVQSSDFTVDLNASSSLALKSLGGFIYINGIIVAQTLAGKYIAVSQACTHEGITVTYDSAADHFYCPAHGSVFSDSGAVINGPANSKLQEFNTSLSGNSLRVYA